MRFAPLLLLPALLACAEPAPPTTAEAELEAVRVVTMSGQALSWEELRIHPVLMQRPCSVGTLVNEEAQIVGYCSRGKQCRTNDWRPVMDGCEAARSPGMNPAPPGSALEVAGRR
ncbi:hypothetical protein E2C06_16095 [Dankookia rubra]|uniref:DUF333 domain-containing protein n=1 Tax=Dankookia rubra TaxID=1442381 RepID=A0A4R5QG14_9PROT|nr:hypothetical protein [Dankookia rubra]TDH61648.1 hypothetical protein E2C06_16095 [Dankookia rubra]